MFSIFCFINLGTWLDVLASWYKQFGLLKNSLKDRKWFKYFLICYGILFAIQKSSEVCPSKAIKLFVKAKSSLSHNRTSNLRFQTSCQCEKSSEPSWFQLFSSNGYRPKPFIIRIHTAFLWFNCKAWYGRKFCLFLVSAF